LLKGRWISINCKVLEGGTQVKGLVLADKKTAESVIKMLLRFKCKYIGTKNLSKKQWKDIRCFVIDGKVVAAKETQRI
jgi:ribosomal protein S6--L-glutamate ligase